jgi:hypothetical protein
MDLVTMFNLDREFARWNRRHLWAFPLHSCYDDGGEGQTQTEAERGCIADGRGRNSYRSRC